MPKIRENQFLRDNQAARFVESSTNTMSNRIGGIFNNTAKTIATNTEIQSQANDSLESINKHIIQSNKLTIGLQKKTIQLIKDISMGGGQRRLENTRDFIRRTDPDTPMRTNIVDIEDILRDMRDNDTKERKKKKSMFGKGLFGSLLGIGGLVGFLLTGKKEMLFSVVKFFKHAGKGLLGMLKIGSKFKKVLSFFGKTGLGIGKGIGKFFKAIFKFKISNIPKVIDSLKDFGKLFTSFKGFSKLISGLFKGSGKLLKGGAKGLLKIGAKGSKTALKKVPVLGAILGVLFGISRAKKGDWIGGLMELGSGVASIVPGVGTALSVAIDGLLLFRDFKGVDVGKGSLNEKLATGMKKHGKTILKNLPGIGTVIRMKEGFDLWKGGNKRGAIKSFGSAMSMILPGGAMLFDMTDKLVDVFREKGIVGGIKSIGSTVKGAAGGVFSKLRNVFGKGEKGDYVFANTSMGRQAFGTTPFGFTDASQKPSKKDIGFHPIRSSRGALRRSMGLQDYPGVSLYKAWNPDFEGLQPDMKRNFVNMANEYYLRTGDDIQVNSAKRSGSKRSAHNFGWAIDINSDDANKLESENLLRKYGFHRPLLNWDKLKEPWHVEPYPGKDTYGPRNTINNNFRVKTLMGGRKRGLNVTPQQGGDEYNIPQGVVEGTYKSKSPINVSLSDKDIGKLAIALGEQMKKLKSKNSAMSNSQMVSGRML